MWHESWLPAVLADCIVLAKKWELSSSQPNGSQVVVSYRVLWESKMVVGQIRNGLAIAPRRPALACVHERWLQTSVYYVTKVSCGFCTTRETCSGKGL